VGAHESCCGSGPRVAVAPALVLLWLRPSCCCGSGPRVAVAPALVLPVAALPMLSAHAAHGPSRAVLSRVGARAGVVSLRLQGVQEAGGFVVVQSQAAAAGAAAAPAAAAGTAKEGGAAGSKPAPAAVKA
jgi:hypothetical protein